MESPISDFEKINVANSGGAKICCLGVMASTFFSLASKFNILSKFGCQISCQNGGIKNFFHKGKSFLSYFSKMMVVLAKIAAMLLALLCAPTTTD